MLIIFNNFLNGTVGVVHTTFASLALVFGTVILFMQKGTKPHKIIGYLFVFSMLIVNITAFLMYELFNGFGIFHFFALLSLFALTGGMYPVLFKKRIKNWYAQHLEVMSWSVVGLYAAFAAEVSVRFIPDQHFFLAIGISGGVITTIGGIVISREKSKLKTTKKN